MLRHKNTNRLYEHWAQKRSHGQPPKRSQIEPSAIATVLANTALIEKQDTGAFIFSLAGSRLASIFGYEITGDLATDIFSVQDHRVINQGFDAVAIEHAAMIVETAGFTQNGRVVAFENVFLPIIDQRPCLLAAIQNMTTPVWLGSEPVLAMEVRSLRMMDLDRELFALTNRPAALFPVDRAGPRPFTSLAANRGEGRFSVISGHSKAPRQPSSAHLHIVDGGKA
ncbi:MAG: PAS domain-containing protein [Ahrensia sp.]